MLLYFFTWSMKYFLRFQAKELENRMESLKISESAEQNASAVNGNMVGLLPPLISSTINCAIPDSHQAQYLNYTLSSIMPNTTVTTQQAISQMPVIAQPNHQMLPQYLPNLSHVSPAQSYSQQATSPVMPIVESPQAALQNREPFWIWRSSHVNLRVFIVENRMTHVITISPWYPNGITTLFMCSIAVHRYIMLQVMWQLYHPMWSDWLCAESISRNIKYISMYKKPC